MHMSTQLSGTVPTPVRYCVMSVRAGLTSLGYSACVMVVET